MAGGSRGWAEPLRQGRRCASYGSLAAMKHRLRDWNVSVSLSGDLDAVHLVGDNANVLPPTPRRTPCTRSPSASATSSPSAGAGPGWAFREGADHPRPGHGRSVRLDASRAALVRAGRCRDPLVRRGARPRRRCRRHGRRTRPRPDEHDRFEFHGFARTTTPPWPRPATVSWPRRSTPGGASTRPTPTGVPAFAGARAALLAAFVDTYSYSLQQTLYAMVRPFSRRCRRSARYASCCPTSTTSWSTWRNWDAERQRGYYAADRPFRRRSKGTC